MKRFTYFLFIAIVGAGLTACSSFSPSTWRSETRVIEDGRQEPSALDTIIEPYSEGLEEEMTKMVGRTAERLEPARPCSALNNWTADALMTNQLDAFGMDKNFMVLLNVGGLRTSFNRGIITLGNVYELMPFDNEVVWVQMPMSALERIETYLKKSGGEPIANARLVNGKLNLNILNNDDPTFWILTSDYLMNGGDKMTFFQDKLDVIFTGQLLRDVFVEEMKKEGTLKLDKTCRIDVD